MYVDTEARMLVLAVLILTISPDLSSDSVYHDLQRRDGAAARGTLSEKSTSTTGEEPSCN
jgi:hypothetical protein